MAGRPPHIARDSIGPNAVTQIIVAARELGYADRLDALFDLAKVRDWLKSPPSEMVDEARVAKLHQTIRAHWSRDEALLVLRRAGELTGAYILYHRIPRFAQAILKCLPRNMAAQALTKAIAAHAWTFSGSGDVRASHDKGETHITIASNPLCRNETANAPVCIWHEAVFTTLYKTLVSSHAFVRETQCCAQGRPACHFSITYKSYK